MHGGGGREERRGGVGQITAHSNPYSSFSLSFFPLCIWQGFDEKILHLAVQYSLKVPIQSEEKKAFNSNDYILIVSA